MIYINTHKAQDVTDEHLKDILELLDRTWPEMKPENKSWEERKTDFLQKETDKQCHILFDDFEVIGYAETFGRIIKAGKKHMRIMGLAAVCIDDDYKSKGLGKDIVKICFGRVSHGEFKASLFQTTVPEFYEKMDCRRVRNKFIDSTSMSSDQNSPFWDEHIMIYPSAFDWPTETIDIQGPGY